MVAGDVAGVATQDLSRGMAERVPDRAPAPGFVDSPLDLIHHSLLDLRSGESSCHLGRRPFLRPCRQHAYRKPGHERRVRVLVRGGVDALSPRGVDHRQALDHPPPVRLAFRLVVGDLDGDARLAAYSERLGHRIEQSLRLIPHMRCVEAAAFGNHPRQFDEFVGIRKPARQILKRLV